LSVQQFVIRPFLLSCEAEAEVVVAVVGGVVVAVSNATVDGIVVPRAAATHTVSTFMTNIPLFVKKQISPMSLLMRFMLRFSVA
jgi:hypothetical protein